MPNNRLVAFAALTRTRRPAAGTPAQPLRCMPSVIALLPRTTLLLGASVVLGALGGCVGVSADSVRSMTDQGLCDLVNGRKYVTTFNETRGHLPRTGIA